MHRDSHTISKLKPNIRIIHIIANGEESARQVKEKGLKRDKSQRKKIETQQEDHHVHHQHMNMLQFTTNYRMKEEENSESIYGSSSVENSSNGFLSGFGSMEGFIQDFGEYPPLFPNFKPTHINMFGETMPLC
ncbi:unnamed protein product [Withania somnifera]